VKAPIERFLRKIEPVPSGCWLWSGGTDPTGYGRFCVADSRMSYAHRYSYEFFTSAIPTGYDIDHLCRVRNCVNPDHLEAVTRSENLGRKVPGPRRSFQPPKVGDAEHGTLATYSNRRCRCDACKSACRAYSAEYAARKAVAS
jgi:hypothetical protein